MNKSTARGSIRYLDGTFFDINWNSVFVPLTKKEYDKYFQNVETLEHTLGRVLSYAELLSLAADLEVVESENY